jgi:hypothetical protein
MAHIAVYPWRKACSLGRFGNACEFMRGTAQISRSGDFLSTALALEAGSKALAARVLRRLGRATFRTNAKGT